MLIEKGADVNVIASSGKTALHIAAEKGTDIFFRHLKLYVSTLKIT